MRVTVKCRVSLVLKFLCPEFTHKNLVKCFYFHFESLTSFTFQTLILYLLFENYGYFLEAFVKQFAYFNVTVHLLSC